MKQNDNGDQIGAGQGAVMGTLTGTRIRERRLTRGLAQGALARQAGISPSYLNLIEHNRRRIGGTILLRIAAALEVDAQALANGGEAVLMAGLREAAGDMADLAGAQEAARAEPARPELDRMEEFAGRFPGWAQLLVATLRRGQEHAGRADALTDRLAHDPHLAASLHEVLSVVTAIRSTASILTDTAALEPEWQARFHRNLGEDSQRLAGSAERLVRYLDDGPGADAGMLSPQDELDRFLEGAGHHFSQLEAGGDGDIDAALQAGGLRAGTGAHDLARAALEAYRSDAAALPQTRLLDMVEALGVAPVALAQHLGAPVARVCRRLAAMPEDAVGPVGLISVDASGAILTLKPVGGFVATRLAGACPLWPLFRAMAQPGMALGTYLVQPGRGARPVRALACTEEVGAPQLNMPPLLRATMLLMPADPNVEAEDAMQVGTSCRICPRTACAARREPSILPQMGAA
ncbi:helix-turn-helix domain-containing protein [Roseovarius arcticus]|uniref:helix-turn-helix domain-containing protein n=1 Tax=Roseovarius arcticus TaxID=2547404 RepID=UPI001FE5E044|nr:helix-turn-helix transcriptional regulator [Roseovarius arcticus]